MILYFLMNGVFPFDGPKDRRVVDKVGFKLSPKQEMGLPDSIKNLLVSMLVFEPEERIKLRSLPDKIREAISNL